MEKNLYSYEKLAKIISKKKKKRMTNYEIRWKMFSLCLIRNLQIIAFMLNLYLNKIEPRLRECTKKNDLILKPLTNFES